MLIRQRHEQIERKPKAVHRAASWSDPDYLLDRDEIAGRLVHIVRCIENGAPLPSGYYRKGIGLDSDGLLRSDGIMHLHLGRSNTSELLYLIQYADHVVLLELSDHAHFRTKPPGARLRSRHAVAVARKERELALEEAKPVLTIKKRPARTTDEKPKP